MLTTQVFIYVQNFFLYISCCIDFSAHLYAHYRLDDSDSITRIVIVIEMVLTMTKK